MDYNLVRPLFMRIMEKKTGSEVLKMFEQFRKNIKLNKTNEQLTPENKS